MTPPLLYISWKLSLLVPGPSEVAFSRSNWEKPVLLLSQYHPLPKQDRSLFQAAPAFPSGGRIRIEQQHLQKQPDLEGEELGSGWDLFPTII